jgi:hypothetical protein
MHRENPGELRFLERLNARLLETEAIVEDFAFQGSPGAIGGCAMT